MSSDFAAVLVGLAVALSFTWLLSGPLKRRPAACYLIAAVASAGYFAYRAAGLYVPWALPFIAAMQRGYCAVFLLAVVMFIGVLGDSSRLRRRLNPVRAELSIASFIFILGHVWVYGSVYVPGIATIASSRGSIGISFVLAVVLFMLFALLTVLSVRVIRKHMKLEVWKAIQRSAYVMVGLLFLHVLFVMGNSAIESSHVRVSLICYDAIVFLYAVLRVRKAVLDAREKRASSLSQVGEAMLFEEGELAIS